MADTAAHAPVNWEAVKTLAIAVGVREAARRLGLSEEAVKRRCSREGWLADPIAREAARQSVQLRAHTTARPEHRPTLSPGAAMALELASLGAKTRVSLARGMAKAGAHVENMEGAAIVADAQNVKAVAQTANLIHGWSEGGQTVRLRLDLLGAASEAPAIEVESEVIDSDVGGWEE